MNETVAAPAIALDRTLVTVAVDVRLADLLGHRPAALCGQRVEALLHPDEGRLRPALLRGAPAGAPVTRLRWRTAIGEYRVLPIVWHPGVDGWSGRLTELSWSPPVAPGRPATAAERLAGVANFTYDIAAGSLAWSPLMFLLFGRDPAQPPPATVAEYLPLLHVEDRDPYMRALQHTLVTGEVAALTVRVARAGGGWRWLKTSLCCELRPDGSPAEVVGSVQDVTEELAARAQLELDRSHALAAARGKSEFLARVSHELRNPVAGVIGMIELAMTDDDEVRRAAQLVSARASARHLLELIDDLLDTSREDSWQFNVVEISFALDEVLAQAVAMVMPRARSKGLTLRGDLAPGLVPGRRGDPLRLRQILINLLHNATKFTEHGQVTARLGPAGPGRVELVVEDTGVGIAPADRARLFEPFVRGASGEAAGEGHGLGLAITHDLILAMGGTIDLASTVGGGTRVTVVLPLAEHLSERSAASARAVAKPPRPREAPPAPLRLLLVEDHPVNADYLRAMLERTGHQLEVVGDGARAVEAATRGDFDVVLMDLELPELDGAAATRAIRAAEYAAGGRRRPIVGISAHRDRARAAAGAGMDGYLVKPVGPGALAAALARVTSDAWRPPIDHTVRLGRVGGRRPLTATIAQTFLDHTGALLEPVDGALASSSQEGLRRAAHGLRAALLMVGALPGAELAAQLEQVALADAAAVRDEIALELARISAELALAV